MDGLYAETLADLHARKRDIDKAIASLEAIRRWATPQQPAAVSPLEGATQQKSLMEAVIEVLRQQGDLMSPADIVTALDDSGFEIGGTDKHRNVGATLNRGKNSGAFTNPERAKWGMAEWDTAAPRRPEPPREIPVVMPAGGDASRG